MSANILDTFFHKVGIMTPEASKSSQSILKEALQARGWNLRAQLQSEQGQEVCATGVLVVLGPPTWLSLDKSSRLLCVASL